MNNTADIETMLKDMIFVRQKAILLRYDKSKNILPTQEELEKCRRELIGDVVIVALSKKLVEIEQHKFPKYMVVKNGKLEDIGIVIER